MVCLCVCVFDYACVRVCLLRFSYRVHSSFLHTPVDIYRSVCSTCSHTALHCDTHCCCRNCSLPDNLEKYGPSSLILNEPKDLLGFYRRWCGGVLNVYIQYLTCSSAVVSSEAGHVYGFAVNREVPYTAHKISVSYWEIFREVRNSTQEQRSCEVQRPARTHDT